MVLVCVENRWTSVFFCSSVQAELLPPPKADLWVTGELFPPPLPSPFLYTMGKMLPGPLGALQPRGGQRGGLKVALSKSSAAAPTGVSMGFRSPWLMLLTSPE